MTFLLRMKHETHCVTLQAIYQSDQRKIQHETRLNHAWSPESQSVPRAASAPCR